MPASVAAILVTYDSGATIERAVTALRAGATAPDPILVVDNGSTDPESLAALERVAADATVIRLASNTGFCAANNTGYRAAGQVDHVLFCNPDAYVTPAFLAEAVRHLDEHPSVGAVGPRLLALDERGEPNGRIDSAGIGQTWYGRFVDLDQGEADDGPGDGTARRALALCAAAVLTRRSALDEVALREGPFDERFFMYKEDVDLGLRLHQAGWGVELRSDLAVLHQRNLPGGLGAHRASSRAARRRSVVNEWRVWRRGTLSVARRLTMLPYLCAKTAAVSLGL